MVRVGRESGRSGSASGRSVDGRFWVGRHREKGLMVFDRSLGPTPRGGVYLFHVSLGRVIGFRREIIREPEHWSTPDEDEARRAVASYTTCAVRPSGAGSVFRESVCFECRASVDSMVSEKCASCGVADVCRLRCVWVQLRRFRFGLKPWVRSRGGRGRRRLRRSGAVIGRPRRGLSAPQSFPCHENAADVARRAPVNRDLRRSVH